MSTVAAASPTTDRAQHYRARSNAVRAGRAILLAVSSLLLLAYILAPQRLGVGDQVIAGERVDVKPGNAMPLSSMPIGTIVYNVEMRAGRGGQIARSAGTFVQLVGRDQGYAILRLSSGEQRKVRAECMASVGAVSNPDHSNQKIGKAGRNRWKGWRPHVRGEVMNPVDHPHGGRTRGGRHPVSPWG